MIARLWLASRSPARAAILAGAGIAFDIELARIDEEAVKAAHADTPPQRIAVLLAEEKAMEVSRRRTGLVLGADQTLDLAGERFDKPGSLEALRTQLLALRGRTHVLHAAIALARDGEKVWSHVAVAHLTVREFSDAFLTDYLAQEGGLAADCVGGYRLEGPGAQLFDRIEGDYFTVLGLPLLPLLDGLRRLGLAES